MTRWRRYGKDRLYVSGEGGVKVGWFDLIAGQPHPETLEDLGELLAAVQDWRAAESSNAESVVSGSLAVESSAAATVKATEMGLVQNPAPPVVDTESVQQVVQQVVQHPDLHSAPAMDSVTAPSVTVSSVPEVAWVDLAGRRAGALAREQAVALKQAAPMRTFLARALRVHTDERAWRIGADGEEKVAVQLGKLQGKDPRWHVLHAVPVGEKGSDIDHVVIGPGGVFTLNAKHHPGAKIWVGGNTFMVNGQRQPYLRNSAHEARRAGRLLSTACGFPVTVVGVVVPVGADDVVIKTPPEQVHVIYRRALTGWLRGRASVLPDDDVNRIYAAARRSTTWQAATT